MLWEGPSVCWGGRAGAAALGSKASIFGEEKLLGSREGCEGEPPLQVPGQAGGPASALGGPARRPWGAMGINQRLFMSEEPVLLLATQEFVYRAILGVTATVLFLLFHWFLKSVDGSVSKEKAPFWIHVVLLLSNPTEGVWVRDPCQLGPQRLLREQRTSHPPSVSPRASSHPRILHPAGLVSAPGPAGKTSGGI